MIKDDTGYIVTIIGMLIMGSMNSFVHFTLLGFMKDLLPKHLIYFMSGIGVAGLISSLFFLIQNLLPEDDIDYAFIDYVLFGLK